MKRVVVLGLVCLVTLLHGMEEAFLPCGAPARLYPAVELGHAINGLEAGEVGESMSAEDLSGQAYHALPGHVLLDEEQKEKPDDFVPAAMFSKRHKRLLSSFASHMASTAFLELETDADYTALKAIWDAGARENNRDYSALERAVAIKLFGLLARKESRPSRDTYRKRVRCRCLGTACFILGGLMMVGGPLIVGLAHPHNCI